MNSNHEDFTVRVLCNTLDSMATSSSVKAYGRYLVPPQLEVAICGLKLLNSSLVNRNIKSSGKRSIFLLTCCFRYFVSTPYNTAKSLSSHAQGRFAAANITFLLLISNILPSIASCGIRPVSAFFILNSHPAVLLIRAFVTLLGFALWDVICVVLIFIQLLVAHVSSSGQIRIGRVNRLVNHISSNGFLSNLET